MRPPDRWTPWDRHPGSHSVPAPFSRRHGTRQSVGGTGRFTAGPVGAEGALRVWASQLDHDTLLSVEGDLDLSTTQCLLEEAAAAVRGSRPGDRLLLDVTGIGFIDSTGTHALEQIRALVEERGGSLLLLGPSPAVAHLLELLGLRPGFRYAERPTA